VASTLLVSSLVMRQSEGFPCPGRGSWNRSRHRSPAAREDRVCVAVLAATLGLCTLGIAAPIFNAWLKNATDIAPVPGTPDDSHTIGGSISKPERARYAFPIVAGGVYSAEEAKRASAEASRGTVVLHPGEALLTDGRAEIRARCGNVVSDAIEDAVSDREPPIEVMDQLVPPQRPLHAEPRRGNFVESPLANSALPNSRGVPPIPAREGAIHLRGPLNIPPGFFWSRPDFWLAVDRDS
jgi:hypothetical protein